MEEPCTADDLAELASSTPFWIQASRQIVGWLPMQHVPLEEPFFDQSVEEFRRSQPACEATITGLDRLTDLARTERGLAPSGFIFHMSRCGSTAVAQALAATKRILVVSEAQPVNALLVMPRTVGGIATARDGWLRSLLSLLGRPRTGAESRFVVKLTSWNALFLADLRALFPDVPWLFLFRNPIEVLVSLVERPPGWIASPIPGGGERSGAAGRELLEEMAARKLASFCDRALASADARSLFFDYGDLDPEGLSRILAHFAISLTPVEMEAARGSLRHDAKSRMPARFQDDSRRKRERASAASRQAAEGRLAEIHQRLQLAAKAQGQPPPAATCGD